MCLVNMEYLGASCVFEFEISIPFPTIVRLPQKASLEKQSLGILKAQAQRKEKEIVRMGPDWISNRTETDTTFAGSETICEKHQHFMNGLHKFAGFLLELYIDDSFTLF